MHESVQVSDPLAGTFHERDEQQLPIIGEHRRKNSIKHGSVNTGRRSQRTRHTEQGIGVGVVRLPDLHHSGHRLIEAPPPARAITTCSRRPDPLRWGGSSAVEERNVEVVGQDDRPGKFGLLGVGQKPDGAAEELAGNSDDGVE